MNTNVRRAVLASLDVKYAEDRGDYVDANDRRHVEKIMVANLVGDEVTDYQVAFTNAYNDAQNQREVAQRHTG